MTSYSQYRHPVLWSFAAVLFAAIVASRFSQPAPLPAAKEFRIRSIEASAHVHVDPCHGQPWPHYDPLCLASLNINPRLRLVDGTTEHEKHLLTARGSGSPLFFEPTSIVSEPTKIASR